MRTIAIALGLLWLGTATACQRGEPARGGEAEVEIDEDLGSLKVTNNVDEPVAIYLDGEEIFTVAPGRVYTFRNLPTGKAAIYGVGRVSQRHYGLPELTIQKGGDYEWTINP